MDGFIPHQPGKRMDKKYFWRGISLLILILKDGSPTAPSLAEYAKALHKDILSGEELDIPEETINQVDINEILFFNLRHSNAMAGSLRILVLC